ncbi:Uncharacterised protein [Vibrio cholerae]|nr:Uncharacterised protein [Vibrio cholerae]
MGLTWKVTLRPASSLIAICSASVSSVNPRFKMIRAGILRASL